MKTIEGTLTNRKKQTHIIIGNVTKCGLEVDLEKVCNATRFSCPKCFKTTKEVK